MRASPSDTTMPTETTTTSGTPPSIAVWFVFWASTGLLASATLCGLWLVLASLGCFGVREAFPTGRAISFSAPVDVYVHDTYFDIRSPWLPIAVLTTLLTLLLTPVALCGLYWSALRIWRAREVIKTLSS
jgi:hypothetical protein